jgi:hypothetical protein
MKRLLLTLLIAAPSVAAQEVELVTGDSTFAVITHKAGFASGAAHNHLVAAAGYRATLAFDAAAPLASRFELKLSSDRLAVDPWDLEQALYPRFEQLGILDQPFSEVADKDRQKIRESMLAKGQLDAAGSPEIVARVTEVREQAATHGEVEFPYAVMLELEVRGRKVVKPVAGRYQVTGGVLTVEAVGSFRFTDFGIEPFSAFLGAVKNQDAFHVYVNLKGRLP